MIERERDEGESIQRKNDNSNSMKFSGITCQRKLRPFFKNESKVNIWSKLNCLSDKIYMFLLWAES